MLKTKEAEIGGHKYILTQLPTAKGLNVLARITKVLGPAFGAAFKTLKADDQVSLGSLGAHGIGELITEFTQRVSVDEFESITQIFVEATHFVKDDGGKTPLNKVYSVQFAGDYGSLLSLLVEHVNLNFASFLAGLGRTGP